MRSQLPVSADLAWRPSSISTHQPRRVLTRRTRCTQESRTAGLTSAARRHAAVGATDSPYSVTEADHSGEYGKDEEHRDGQYQQKIPLKDPTLRFGIGRVAIAVLTRFGSLITRNWIGRRN